MIYTYMFGRRHGGTGIQCGRYRLSEIDLLDSKAYVFLVRTPPALSLSFLGRATTVTRPASATISLAAAMLAVRLAPAPS